jgi:TrbL/VirB6 plasmid conjugal transfer protein
MRRLRLPRKTAIVLALLVTVLAVPRASQAAAAARTGAAPPAAATARTTADTTTTGGVCSVPGVGDIGGLLGFCSLGSSGLIGDLNNICQPSLPDPEPANGGINAMIAPPASGKQPSTLYSQYGVAGDYWAATNLQCSDMTSLIGNNVAGMVFDVAKSIDRVTITVYQSAAGEGILGWLQNVTDRLISSLGNAIYFPYLALVVVLGAIWLAWQGLIRKRGTRTIEGTIWMVVACAAAILLIGKPADVTGLGKGVSDGMSQALNAAFAKLPSPGPTSCVPLQTSDPQAVPSTYSYTSGNTVVDQNADELWTVLVCKPWLDGEFGASDYAGHGGKATAVNTYGRALLWAQAIAVDEKPTQALISAKQAAYAGIASSIQSNDPAIYPLFQGKQWTTRLEVGFAALFAAVVAGVLVLLISVTLILLKLGFLLLLIAGPFFLLIGTHPGFGRVVAMRWLELLVGVLLKQAAVAVVLSVLLYCYALIMGTSDAVLPWALKILMIALVTVAAFIYRKPFQHLFAAVGYGVIGSHDQAAADMQRAGATARAGTIGAATLAVPPFAAYRAGRWARRNPAQAASLAVGATGAAAAGAAAAAVADGETDAGATAGDRAALAARVRAWPESNGSAASDPPPLNLRERNGAGSGSPASAAAPRPASANGQSRSAWPAGRQPAKRQTEPRQAPAPAARPGSAPSAKPAAPAASAAPAGRQQARAPSRPGTTRATEPGGAPPPPWHGQPMSGPLAGRDPARAPERAAPFWLRPRRRK